MISYLRLGIWTAPILFLANGFKVRAQAQNNWAIKFESFELEASLITVLYAHDNIFRTENSSANFEIAIYDDCKESADDEAGALEVIGVVTDTTNVVVSVQVNWDQLGGSSLWEEIPGEARGILQFCAVLFVGVDPLILNVQETKISSPILLSGSFSTTDNVVSTATPLADSVPTQSPVNTSPDTPFPVSDLILTQSPVRAQTKTSTPTTNLVPTQAPEVSIPTENPFTVSSILPTLSPSVLIGENANSDIETTSLPTRAPAVGIDLATSVPETDEPSIVSLSTPAPVTATAVSPEPLVSSQVPDEPIFTVNDDSSLSPRENGDHVEPFGPPTDTPIVSENPGVVAQNSPMPVSPPSKSPFLSGTSSYDKKPTLDTVNTPEQALSYAPAVTTQIGSPTPSQDGVGDKFPGVSEVIDENNITGSQAPLSRDDSRTSAATRSCKNSVANEANKVSGIFALPASTEDSDSDTLLPHLCVFSDTPLSASDLKKALSSSVVSVQALCPNREKGS